MTIISVSRRSALSAASIVVATVVTFLLASSTSAGLATAATFDIAILALTALTSRGLRADHPVLFRSLLSLLIVDVALFTTFFFSATTNFDLATGASMSIVLLGLSFLTVWARSPWPYGPITMRRRRSSLL
jgi:hypothetical protein